MKKITVLLVLVFVFSVHGLAVHDDGNGGDTGSAGDGKIFEVEYSSLFLTRDIEETGLSLNSGSFWRNGLSVEHTSSGLYMEVGYYHRVGKNHEGDMGDRAQFQIGWRYTHADTGTLFKVDVEYFEFFHLRRDDFLKFETRIELSKVNLKGLFLTPFVSYSRFEPTNSERSDFERGGDFITGGFLSEIQLPRGFTFKSLTSLGYRNHVLGESGKLFVHSSGLDYEWSKRLTLNLVTVALVAPITPVGEARRDVVWSTGFRLRF